MSLQDERAKLLGLLQARARRWIVFPIRRRPPIAPDDFRNMINPLRIRRDYTSVGRPTFLVGYHDLPSDDPPSDE